MNIPQYAVLSLPHPCPAVPLQVRVVRSIELVAQRRRVDNHLKAQEKAVQQQQSQFDAAVLELRADAAEWRAKLLGYERLLGSALSSKGIDICWREAQALRVKLDRELEQRMHQLQQLVQKTCSALDATSTAFEAECLKSFAGEYMAYSLDAAMGRPYSSLLAVLCFGKVSASCAQVPTQRTDHFLKQGQQTAPAQFGSAW